MRPITIRGALGLFVMTSALGCGAQEAEPAPRGAAVADTSIAMAFDYAGAEALIAALERDSLTSADVDSLLRVHGVRAMVDNVTRFVPGVGEPGFRAAIQAFARTKRQSDGDGQYFRLDRAWSNRKDIRALIGRIRENEPAIRRRVLVDLAPYRPRTGPLAMTAYFVAGGVSTGFVPDDTSAARFYANLADANGDYDGVVENVIHEAYHLMQKAAQRRVPALVAIADSVESRPGPERLLATTLAEGTAKYVVEPAARHGRNGRPGRVRENFAVFDTVLAGLRSGRLDWTTAYQRGFTSAEEERFYFVGHEMTKAIARRCGDACIGRLFEEHPVEFFRRYVRLYRERPEIVGRFSPATEAFLEGTVR